MKKPASLQPVLELAEQKRDDALQRLGQAQRELQQAEQQMSQLQDYTAESLQRWSQRATLGVSPTLLHTHQQFMAKLDDAVAFQNGVLQRMHAHVAHCQQQVQEAERELASLKKFTQRREEAWQHQLQQQEQKRNDEMAANVFRRQAQATR